MALCKHTSEKEGRMGGDGVFALQENWFYGKMSSPHVFNVGVFAEVKVEHEVGGDGTMCWIYENVQVCVFVEVNTGHKAGGDGIVF
jgi:hypothetical protein